MGYESKLYFVNRTKSMSFDHKDFHYGQIVAQIDMSVYRSLREFVERESKPTNVFIYADDGNTELVEDKYGDPLAELTLEQVQKFVCQETLDGVVHWRLSLLKSLVDTFMLLKQDIKMMDIVVLHFGH